MIEIEKLYYSYNPPHDYILSDLNLCVHDGEYISIVGENGCGKSTLMRLILGFIKPTSGSLVCAANRIGYVPQKKEFIHSGFPITVYEALNSYRKLLKISDKKVIAECLNKVGMTGHLNSLIGNLSGGQNQKVLIARALIGEPHLIILDEPSTGIDMGSQEEIYSVIKSLNVNSNITILSVEHNLDAAIANSTSIYHMRNSHGHLCTPEQYANEYFGRKGGR